MGQKMVKKLIGRKKQLKSIIEICNYYLSIVKNKQLIEGYEKILEICADCPIITDEEFKLYEENKRNEKQ